MNEGGEPDNLRMLRLLTAYNIFEEHLMSNEVIKFSLADVGKSLAEDGDGFSYAPYMLQHQQHSYMKTWPLLKDVVERTHPWNHSGR